MGRMGRIVSAVFGVFLVGVGGHALSLGHVSVPWRVLGGVALIATGANLVYSAWRNRESWIAKIGPLP